MIEKILSLFYHELIEHDFIRINIIKVLIFFGDYFSMLLKLFKPNKELIKLVILVAKNIFLFL